MTGDGRADYVAVNPETGSLTLWHNRCWPTGDDDDDNNNGGGGDDDNDDNDKFPWEGRHFDEFCGDLSRHAGLSPAEKSYIWGSEGRGLGVGQWLDREVGRLQNKDEHWLKELVELYRDKIDKSAWNDWKCNDIYSMDHCTIGDLECSQSHCLLNRFLLTLLQRTFSRKTWPLSGGLQGLPRD